MSRQAPARTSHPRLTYDISPEIKLKGAPSVSQACRTATSEPSRSTKNPAGRARVPSGGLFETDAVQFQPQPQPQTVDLKWKLKVGGDQLEGGDFEPVEEAAAVAAGAAVVDFAKAGAAANKAIVTMEALRILSMDVPPFEQASVLLARG
jgi:hypothetical protein